MAGNEDKIRKNIADNLNDIVGDKASADIASKVELPKNGGEIDITVKGPVENTGQQQQSAQNASQPADDYEYDLTPDEIEALVQSGDIKTEYDFNPDDFLDDHGGEIQLEEDSPTTGGTTATHNESNGTSETSQPASNDSASKNTSETPHVALHPSSSSSKNTASKENPANTIANDVSNVSNDVGNAKKDTAASNVSKNADNYGKKKGAHNDAGADGSTGGAGAAVNDKKPNAQSANKPDLSQAQRVAAQSAADTQRGRAQKNIPNANNNAGNGVNNSPQANPMLNAGSGAAGAGAANQSAAGDNANMPTGDSNAAANGDNQSPEEQLADQLFNNQQSDFDAQKVAAREKIDNDHDGSKFNSAIDNASNAVNDKMTGIANGINNRMQANNGGIFKDNGSLLNNVGNGLWKHGGSNLTAKGLNAVNNGLQGALRGVQNMGQKIAKNVQKLVSIVTNPVFWYSLGAVVVVIAIITMTLTYGNGGITCPNQGTGGGSYGDQIASWAEKIAADDSHGYSQKNRDGNTDYDCSSLVYYAVTQGAGIQLSISYPFSTANEREVLKAAGFTEQAWDGKDTSVLKRGDILWRDGHTEIYSGDGKFTGAHMNEKNGTGLPPEPESAPGDQTGHEISTESAAPYPVMTYYLRSPGKNVSDSGTTSGGGASADFNSENAKQVFDYLTNDMGFSGAGAAGALAVAMRESSFDPTATNSGGGVAGIFQWSGFSNTVNGSRITQEGSIKAGDTSTLTMENEIKLLGFELNGGYHKAKVTVGNASDPAQAAKDWSVLFEGVSIDDGQSKVSKIEQWSNQACDTYNCKSITAQPDKLNQGGNGASDLTNTSTTKNASTEVQCMMTKNANTGSTGDFPNGQGDYSWMCNDERIKVCKDGDTGPVPAPYKYQCVWYAWTRLYMIHGINETYQANGGEIGEKATQHGWTNPDKPSPGDGLSYYGLFGSSKRPTGHVMVVEKVEDDPSGWKITLSEGNYACSSSGCWNGYHGGRTLTKAQLESAGGVQGQNYWFFHNPKWDSNK